jgi:hypothetical protein
LEIASISSRSIERDMTRLGAYLMDISSNS